MEVTHRFGREKRAVVLAGGEEPVTRVAAVGQVGDRLVHQRLIHQTQALTGHRPRLARRARDQSPRPAGPRPRRIHRHVGPDGQLSSDGTGFAGPLVPLQTDVPSIQHRQSVTPAARTRDEVEDQEASLKSSCVGASVSPRHAHGEHPSITPCSSPYALVSLPWRAARSAAVTWSTGASPSFRLPPRVGVRPPPRAGTGRFPRRIRSGEVPCPSGISWGADGQAAKNQRELREILRCRYGWCRTVAPRVRPMHNEIPRP